MAWQSLPVTLTYTMPEVGMLMLGMFQDVAAVGGQRLGCHGFDGVELKSGLQHTSLSWL